MKIIKKIKRLSADYRAHELALRQKDVEIALSQFNMVNVAMQTAIQAQIIACTPREKSTEGGIIYPNRDRDPKIMDDVEIKLGDNIIKGKYNE